MMPVSGLSVGDQRKVCAHGDLPRLSVDIDLAWLPVHDYAEDAKLIAELSAKKDGWSNSARVVVGRH